MVELPKTLSPEEQMRVCQSLSEFVFILVKFANFTNGWFFRHLLWRIYVFTCLQTLSTSLLFRAIWCRTCQIDFFIRTERHVQRTRSSRLWYVQLTHFWLLHVSSYRRLSDRKAFIFRFSWNFQEKCQNHHQIYANHKNKSIPIWPPFLQ